MAKLNEIIRYIQSVPLITIDIETDMLDKRASWKYNAVHKKIQKFGIGDDKKQFVLKPSELSRKVLKRIKRALKGKKVCYHNGNFDILFLWEKYRVTMPITDDTMMLCYLLDESRKLEDLRLKDMAPLYLGVKNWDIGLKAKTTASKEQDKYLRKDVKYTTMLRTETYGRLDKTYRKIYHKLLIPAYREYIKMHKRGIKVNLQLAEKNSIAIAKKMVKVMSAIEVHVGGPINLNSPNQKSEYLYGKLGLPVLAKTPKGNPSTGKDVLKELLGEHPVIELILEYDTIKMTQRYLKKTLEEHINGRLYPTFNVFGTATGRTSCAKPNLQQIPRDKLIRNVFIARKGYKFVEIDYSQLELRVASDRANEKTMIKIYKHDGDIHTETGKTVTGKKVLTYDDRTGAKAVNFGFLYGMLAKGFRKYAKSTYGVVFTMIQAQAYRQRFFAKYSGLMMWHRKEIAIAQVRGYTENKIGRRRMLPNIRSNNNFIRGQDERKAINTPIQSFANDIIISTLPVIGRDKFLKKRVRIVGIIHDAIVFEIMDGPDFDKCLSMIKNYMENPAVFKVFNVKMAVPLKVDVEIGPWGAGVEWKPEEHFCIGCNHHMADSDVCGITGCQECTEKDPSKICPRLNNHIWDKYLGGKKYGKKGKKKAV